MKKMFLFQKQVLRKQKQFFKQKIKQINADL